MNVIFSYSAGLQTTAEIEALRLRTPRPMAIYLCESEATATTRFYLCESEATATTRFYLCESEATATTRFYLCESEKRQQQQHTTECPTSYWFKAPGRCHGFRRGAFRVHSKKSGHNDFGSN